MYKQIIIARKDLNMSAGKLAAQVSHASMAFLTTIIRNNTVKRYDNLYIAWESKKDNKPQWYRRPDLHEWAKQARERGEDYFYAQPVNPKDPYGKLEFREGDNSMIRQQLIALLSKTGDNDTEVYMRGNNSFIIPITDAIIMGDGSGKDEICLIDGDVEISIDKAMIDLKEQTDNRNIVKISLPLTNNQIHI